MKTNRTFCLMLVVSLGLGITGCSQKPPLPPAPMEILRHNQDAMFALGSYRAICMTSLTSDQAGVSQQFEVARLTAGKPTKMRYDSWRIAAPTDSVPGTTPDITFACDGSDRYMQVGRAYRKVPSIAPDEMQTVLEPWTGFYSNEDSPFAIACDIDGLAPEVGYKGSDLVEGVTCDLVAIHRSENLKGEKVGIDTTYYIARPDWLIRRAVEHITFESKPGFTRDAVLHHIEANMPIDGAVYKYIPPAGVILQKEPTDSPLLANGVKAPDFTVLDADNIPIELSTLRGKVVVLDFWATWCPPCVASMPHTNEVAKKLADAGVPVMVLAVDNGEKRKPFDAWVAAKRAIYPNIRFAHMDPSNKFSEKLYRVTGIPTQYVIDRRGKIQASLVGFGGKGDDRLEKAVLAANHR